MCKLHWKFQVTCAWSGFRHVAKICFVGLFDASNCLTMPKPSPRLQPVIRIEFMFDFISLSNFSLTQYRICSSNQRVSGQTTQSNVYLIRWKIVCQTSIYFFVRFIRATKSHTHRIAHINSVERTSQRLTFLMSSSFICVLDIFRCASVFGDMTLWSWLHRSINSVKVLISFNNAKYKYKIDIYCIELTVS